MTADPALPDASEQAALTVRAIRGAIQVDRDDPRDITTQTQRLLTEVMRRNELTEDDLISVFFTATPDLVSCFPAEAARRLGLTDVPLLCATEISVPGALGRVVRLLAHVRTARPRAAVNHVYLDGAARLRPDLAG
ncbi:chorismate mutase [Micromonospora sp. KC213]|uniref:chorismate mutase n=1 Tax=Micromonospora sp. KC213 TaxID=2530378 RepID=UPI001FB80A88|nr:chorismate mutase [Micromonospora sp. KC213]